MGKNIFQDACGEERGRWHSVLEMPPCRRDHRLDLIEGYVAGKTGEREVGESQRLVLNGDVEAAEVVFRRWGLLPVVRATVLSECHSRRAFSLPATTDDHQGSEDGKSRHRPCAECHASIVDLVARLPSARSSIATSIRIGSNSANKGSDDQRVFAGHVRPPNAEVERLLHLVRWLRRMPRGDV